VALPRAPGAAVVTARGGPVPPALLFNFWGGVGLGGEGLLWREKERKREDEVRERGGKKKGEKKAVERKVDASL